MPAAIPGGQHGYSPSCPAGSLPPSDDMDLPGYARLLRDAARLARWIRDRLQRYKLPPKVLEGLLPEKKALHERRPKVWLDRAFEKSSDDFLTKKINHYRARASRVLLPDLMFHTTSDE